MALEDLREIHEQPKLTLPIGGRSYVVGPVTADVWLRLQGVAEGVDRLSAGSDMTADILADTNLDEMGLFRLCLGATLDELLPIVTPDELRKIGVTAFFWQLGRQDVAETVWRLGGKAKAPIKKAPKPRTGTNTGSASTTRKPVSTRTTTSRKKSASKSTPRTSRGASS